MSQRNHSDPVDSNQGALPYVLLKKVQHDKSKITTIVLENPSDLQTYEQLNKIVRLSAGTVVAIDLETTGLEAHNYAVEVVGLSLATREYAVYFHVKDNNKLYELILDFLMENQTPLIAHNLMFDGAFLTRDYCAMKGIETGYYQDFKFLNYYACTYVALRILSGESFPNQSYGLKPAQVNLLGWEEKGDVELDAWLVENGYTNNRKDAQKGEMWRAPPQILGHYCCLDAASTHALWDKVLRPVAVNFKAANLFITKYWLDEIKHLIAGQLLGVRIAGEQLRIYQIELTRKLESSRLDVIKMVRPQIDKYNQKVLDGLLKKMPAQFKKIKKTLCNEPKKYKKDGTVSEKWQKWELDKITIDVFQPEESAHYKKWQAKVDLLRTMIRNYEKLSQDEVASYGLFNLGSPLQKQWLFYEALGFEVKVWTNNEDNPQPATGGDALLGFGEVGKAFQLFSDITKELGYVEKAISLLLPHAWESGEFLHFQFKTPGTITGRLSGTGGINVQQVPKTRGYLDCYVPREGHIWVDFDVAALEPHVLAETSRDKSLLKLYGPNAKPNDIYIFVGSSIPGIKDSFLEEGYNPDNPTKEAIDACKKKHKNLRGICKTLCLGASYGAGPSKIRESLALSGVIKSLAEVKSIHEAYWKLYAGTKEYEKYLQQQWEKTGGYVFNATGRPICVDSSRIKDLVNSSTQSAGHDILQVMLNIYGTLLREANIPYTPIIWDFHDECLIEVPVGRVDEVVEIIKQTFDKTNEALRSSKSIIKFKGSTAICKTLSDAKLED